MGLISRALPEGRERQRRGGLPYTMSSIAFRSQVHGADMV